MKPVYPLLQAYEWEHADKVACILLDEEFEYSPLIAFGFDADTRFEYLPEDEKLDYDEIFDTSLDNLAKHQYEWETFEHDGIQFAASSGNTFSSEKVLDEAHMQKACELLGSELLMVAAPRRTCLFATKHDPNEPDDVRDLRYEMFNKMIKSTFEDDSYGHAPISQAIYLIDGGEIYEVVEGGWDD
ncbi:hypothetical protein [Bremerella sp.]|uniref:hypothetical protein n=1 Tax=Bremerella sp. TaxID=2795602 RepID=UPI003918C6EC